MEATSLFNYRTSDFETVESFSKRLYETARRYNKNLIFTASESRHVVMYDYFNVNGHIFEQ